jgi:hypothetical protein
MRPIDSGLVAGGVCAAAALLIMATMSTWGLQLLDDGYYYLQVAANISRGAGSTFDGIHPTNGYHPLWQLALVPLHRVASKPTAAWLAVGLQTLLFAASGLVLCRLVRRTGAGAEMATAACSFWVLNLWLWGKGAMSGMETGLLLLLFGLGLNLLLRTLRTGRGGASLGIVLALATAARLDTVALALAAAVVLLLRRMRRQALRATAPTAAYLAVYLPLNAALFGGAVPVSGHIKSRVGRELVSRLLAGGDPALLSHAASNLRELLTLGGRVPLAAPLALMPVLLFLALRAGKRGGGALRGMMAATGIYGAVLLGFYALLYTSLLGTYTYYWLPLLYALVGVAFASLAVCGRRLRRWLTVAALLLLLAFDLVYAADRLGSWSFSVPEEDRPEAAGVRFLDSLEGEVLVGSWDAGYLGWKCRHPVVNLDGLVSSYRYQEFLRERGVAEWIRREGITHLANVDYHSGKRELIEEELGWSQVFADTTAMPRAVSLFSLSPSGREYASRGRRVFYVYARGNGRPVRGGLSGL